MFAGTKSPGPKARANRVLKHLASHALTLTHARHIGFHEAKAIGLNVTALEEDNDLQDAVLTVHHLCEQTITQTGVMKLTENQDGVTFAQVLQLAHPGGADDPSAGHAFPVGSGQLLAR